MVKYWKQHWKTICVHTLGIFFFLGVGFFMGFSTKYSTPVMNIFSDKEIYSAHQDVDFELFWQVWDILDAKYPFAKITNEEKMYGAIQGLTTSIDDPYTTFFKPEESKIFQEDITGSFSGVGMEVGVQDSLLVVIAPLKDSPAEKAGVQTGDIIMTIDGTSADTLNLDQAIQLIRGKKGTDVVLQMAREGESELKEITITRDVIKVPTLDTKFIDDKTFYIGVYSFTGNITKDFTQAIEQFANSSAQFLIIDVRNNPGGYLDAAIDMASFFIPQGKVIVSEDFGDTQETQHHVSKGFSLLTNKKFTTVILVNQGSASASEIFAGALQDYQKATLMGDKTFGKGSVQELINLSGDSSLKVTIAKWLTPRDRSIDHNGLLPDISLKEVDLSEDKDVWLDEAVKFLHK